MKSGPGTCRRSFEIFGDLKFKRESALFPSSCSMVLTLAVAMCFSLIVLETIILEFQRKACCLRPDPPAREPFQIPAASVAKAVALVRTDLPVPLSVPALYPLLSLRRSPAAPDSRPLQ